MKRVMVLLFAWGLAAAGWGDEGRVGLVIDFYYHSLDDGYSKYQEKISVDSGGRISQIWTRIEPSNPDETAPEKVQTILWSSGDKGPSCEVRTAGRAIFSLEWDGEQLVQRDGPLTSSSQVRSLWSIQTPGESTTWSSSRYRFEWSPLTGFQSQRILGPGESDEGLDGFTTKGSLLISWARSHEQDRMILDKDPRRFLGTFYQEADGQNRWLETGSMRVSGPGLWSDDSRIRLMHWVLACSPSDWPLVTPFIFQKNFLK